MQLLLLQLLLQVGFCFLSLANVVKQSNLSTRCHYLCCQREDQKGGAGEQGGELPVQDKRGGQVRSQREVLGHLQEARKLQEDEGVLRPVQFGNWGHTEGAEGAEQTDVRIQEDYQQNIISSLPTGSEGHRVLHWRRPSRR